MWCREGVGGRRTRGGRRAFPSLHEDGEQTAVLTYPPPHLHVMYVCRNSYSSKAVTAFCIYPSSPSTVYPEGI